MPAGAAQPDGDMSCNDLQILQVSYLLVFPVQENQAGELNGPIRGLKDAPYFDQVDIVARSLPALDMRINDVPVHVQRQVFDDQIQVDDCRFSLPDGLATPGIQRRQRLQAELRRQLLPPAHQQDGMFEEYVILLAGETGQPPEEFIDCHAPDLARFIRSQREVFGPQEIEEILTSRVRYSEAEITVVDWEGAVIVSPNDDFQSDIELLKIGNYQLLRYRMLDQQVEALLRRLHHDFHAGLGRSARLTPARGALAQVVQHRLELMFEFERIEQALLLIGDWYTTKLYHAIHDEFYLDDWKRAVQAKLDNMESIVSTIQDNFSLSWTRLLDMVEIAGWLILLIGYFILFFFEISPK